VKRGQGRPQKIGDLIQRELSDLLYRELRDPRVGMVTITSVDVSPDMSHALVYFTCLDAKQAEAAAQPAPFHGWPMMSCSPASSTPAIATWLPPRACSIVPVPLAGVHACVDPGGTGAVAAELTLIIPAPSAARSRRASGEAVDVKSAFA